MPSPLPPSRLGALELQKASSRHPETTSDLDQLRQRQAKKRRVSTLIAESSDQRQISTQGSHPNSTLKSSRSSLKRSAHRPNLERFLSNHDDTPRLNSNDNLQQKGVLPTNKDSETYNLEDSNLHEQDLTQDHRSDYNVLVMLERNTNGTLTNDVPQAWSFTTPDIRTGDREETFATDVASSDISDRQNNAKQRTRGDATQGTQKRGKSSHSQLTAGSIECDNTGSRLAEKLLARHGSDAEAMIQQFLVFAEKIHQHIRSSTAKPNNDILHEYFGTNRPTNTTNRDGQPNTLTTPQAKLELTASRISDGLSDCANQLVLSLTSVRSMGDDTETVNKFQFRLEAAIEVVNYLLDHTLGGKAEHCVKQVVQEQLILSRTAVTQKMGLAIEGRDSQDMIDVLQTMSNVFAGESNPKKLFQKAVNLRNNTKIFRICGKIQGALCRYIEWKTTQHEDGITLSRNDADTEKLFDTFETDTFWIQHISDTKTAPKKTLVYSWIAKRLEEAKRRASKDNLASLESITGQQLYNRFRKFAFSQVLEEEFASDGIWLLFAANGVDPLWKMSTWSEHGGDRVLMLRYAVQRFLATFPNAKEVVKSTEEMLTKEIGLEGTIKPLFRHAEKANPVYWDGVDFSCSKSLPAQIWDRLRAPVPK